MMATRTPRARVREDYSLRFADAEEANRDLEECGFVRLAPAEIEAGDLLLVESGPGQLHAVILTEEGYLHAHAGLRRVVETPGPVPWPILSAWCPGDFYEPDTPALLH